jgi:hypothetical protein
LIKQAQPKERKMIYTAYDVHKLLQVNKPEAAVTQRELIDYLYEMATASRRDGNDAKARLLSTAAGRLERLAAISELDAHAADRQGMSHDEFEATMKRISRMQTEVWQAEVDTYYNVSRVSAEALRRAETELTVARDEMGFDS